MQGHHPLSCNTYQTRTVVGRRYASTSVEVEILPPWIEHGRTPYKSDQVTRPSGSPYLVGKGSNNRVHSVTALLQAPPAP